MCGEKPLLLGRVSGPLGSPPRMRGKGCEGFHGRITLGITPAYAGKRARPGGSAPLRRDHPRTCGEKGFLFLLHVVDQGSPPHMRGKADSEDAEDEGGRITPAHAGKRTDFPAGRHPDRDHPRTCGEKDRGSLFRVISRGSPPHMRGKGSRKYLGMVNLRITPAHAGKSPELLHVIIVQWDHPRVCGEK